MDLLGTLPTHSLSQASLGRRLGPSGSWGNSQHMPLSAGEVCMPRAIKRSRSHNSGEEEVHRIGVSASVMCAPIKKGKNKICI